MLAGNGDHFPTAAEDTTGSWAHMIKLEPVGWFHTSQCEWSYERFTPYPRSSVPYEIFCCSYTFLKATYFAKLALQDSAPHFDSFIMIITA